MYSIVTQGVLQVNVHYYVLKRLVQCHNLVTLINKHYLLITLWNLLQYSCELNLSI